MEDLPSTPKHFVSLDNKVAAAIQLILNQSRPQGKSLQSRMTMKMQELLENNSTLLTGRQAVFMLSQNFKTANDTETYLGIEHLANLMMVNNDLEQFWIRWEQMIGQLPRTRFKTKVSRRFSTQRFVDTQSCKLHSRSTREHCRRQFLSLMSGYPRK